MEHGADAVVVGRVDVGDADRVMRFLTADHGRLDLMARGARSSRRRFGPVLELGSRVFVVWRRGKGDLSSLDRCDPIALPKRAREGYDRVVLLAYGCELAYALSAAGQGNEKLFRLLLAWLDLLEAEGDPGHAARVAFEAKALTFSGLTPALTRCAVCGEPLSGEVRFDPEAGGGVHVGCGPGKVVDATVLAVLDTLRRTALADVGSIELPKAGRWLLADFVEHHHRARMRSRALLDTMEGA
jgi:DNA repair protein RecO (recombination protein O)